MRSREVGEGVLAASVMLLAIAAGLACHATPAPVARQGAAGATIAADTVQSSNDSTVRAILGGLGERAALPAESVFKNVRYERLRAIPARQFLSIMNGGYARALGVTCAHCHVTSDFAADDKRPKRAAREMQVMHTGINQQLQKMQELRAPLERRFINCATCHRGQVSPLMTR